VELLKKKNSKFYWYDFTVRGQRYRGSTKETNITRAGKIGALKLTHAIEGYDPLDRKAPTLLEFSSRFVEWVNTARLEFDTRRYYLNGWRLLQTTRLPNMRLDRITADVVEGVHFSGSPANGNNALRTLRRMLNKAREWKVIRDVPDFKLFKEEGRALRLDDQAEAKLLPVADQPLQDIIVLLRDTGVRNARELYRMRVENIDWNNRVIFNPNSKTKKGRRFIPIRDRVMSILLVRCADRKEGWVFPSRQKGKHITGGLVNKQWVRARKKRKTRKKEPKCYQVLLPGSVGAGGQELTVQRLEILDSEESSRSLVRSALQRFLLQPSLQVRSTIRGVMVSGCRGLVQG